MCSGSEKPTEGNKSQPITLAGCSKWSSGKAAASEEAKRTIFWYVEPLSEARTKPVIIFSIPGEEHAS
jgi:hypothetical protein